MAEHRTKKNKENPHYSFLVNWQPSEAYVKRESASLNSDKPLKLTASKKAEIQAKEDSILRVKKDIIKNLILVSFILILEVVVYLARSRFGLV